MEYYEALKNFGVGLIVIGLIGWAVCCAYWFYRQKRIQRHMLEIYGADCCANPRGNAYHARTTPERRRKRGKTPFRTRRKKNEEGAERT